MSSIDLDTEPLVNDESARGASLSDRQRAADELRSQRGERWALLRRSPAFIIGSLITLFWLVCALFGRIIAPQDAYVQDLLGKLKGPSGAHWFGTDGLGRDVFSRVIVGSRTILFIALGATILGTILGTIMGLVAGYFKGLVDDILMRFADVMMSMPVIVLALLVIAMLASKSALVVLGIIGIVYTPIIARTVRAAVLGEAELDYVAAARLRTEKTPHVLFVEILPNILPPLLVEFTVRLGYAIFAVATLSFLGAGVTAESPDWGTQVATHRQYLTGLNWSATLFPALAIASLAVGINLMTDALSEAFER
jgi:peptide/nickel transport system permease protein